MKKLKNNAQGFIVCLLISLLACSGVFAQGKIKLVAMGPTQVKPGVGFNLQPDGSSAMWVKTENATKDTIIVWGTQKLPTTYANPNLLTAIVPKPLFGKPGKFNIYLLNQKNNEKSNSLVLTVK